MNISSNPKKLQILATGKELLWKFGYKRVTIEEICRTSGVSKMTFYKFFPNKLELAKVILDEIFDENIERIRTLSVDPMSPAKKLQKILQLKEEGTRDIGEEFIKDLYSTPEAELKSYMEEKSKTIYAEIMKLYEQGKEDGWIRKDLNIPFFLTFTSKVVGIFSEDEMLHYFDSSQQLIMEITNLFVYGISPHE